MVEMDDQLDAALRRLLRQGLEERPHPSFSGAVAQIAVRDRVLPAVAEGYAVQWADATRRLPEAQRVPMRVETRFDIASLTKVCTAVVALRVLAAHGIRLNDQVAPVLPEYADPPRDRVTWRQLLTHTSGLPATSDVWQRHSTPGRRREMLLRTPLEADPGMRYEYSCVGYITAGVALERVSGHPLDLLLEQEICAPLGLAHTAFRPRPDDLSLVAATEADPRCGRGMIHGQVHDETAWSIGGVSANAGVFSTAGDLIRLGRALSTSDSTALLGPDQRRWATRDQRPAGAGGGHGQAIGLRVGDPGLLPGLPHWCGHTGFTGTSMIVEPDSGTVGVLLTNRVHPTRDRSDLGPLRRRFTELVRRAHEGSRARLDLEGG